MPATRAPRPTLPRLLLAIASLALATPQAQALRISGRVVDLDGRPLPQVQVLFEREAGAPGASVVTVFTDDEGRFRFPADYPETIDPASQLRTRTLDHEQLGSPVTRLDSNNLELDFVLRPTSNQAAVAPASAWLARIRDRERLSAFIMDCIDCHQVPAPEVRNYATLLADHGGADGALARAQGWSAIVRYMDYLSAWEFSRGRRGAGEQLDSDAVYGVDNPSETANLLARVFDDRLDSIEGYDWGAPPIATPDTVILEYEVPAPNAVREALLSQDRRELWVADVSANRMIAIDVASGAQRSEEVPSEVLMSPHSLHRGSDGRFWITPLFNSIVASVQPGVGDWQLWRLRTEDGRNPGIHDLSFGYQHELLTDARGRIWFSDIGNNSVGYFDPGEGNSRIWPAPPSPGRPGRTSLYGLSMNAARDQVWYSQLGNGTFGGFDIERQQYIGPFQLPDRNAGPRRLTIDDQDVLYLALYGSGQLAEFDTRSNTLLGIHDLPDVASAPYAATWDPVRRVVWVATSNGDVIYRFDPATKQFGVLPLPRAQAFLRMIDIDPATGVLVTSYGNIVDVVQGPRMALIIDPGDGAYPQKFTTANAMPARGNANQDFGSPLGNFIGQGTAGMDGAALATAARCQSCHQAEGASLGPPWAAIAARHAGADQAQREALARKIVDGGGGNWGLVPMVPNQWVSLDEARIMADWILSLAE